MSLLRKLHLIKSMLTAVLAAPLLMSCYNYDSEEVEMTDASEKFINLRIAVSTGSQTRAGAIPADDYNGDGREAGFERENAVSGVTVIFYQGTGINDVNAADIPIDYCAYYSVTLDSREAQGTNESPHKDEAIYTTGNRSIKGTPINIANQYHIIIVANLNLASQITAGVTTLADVRDMVWSKAYDGSGKGIDATNFLMASEEDPTIIDFSSATPAFENPDHYIYSFSGFRIERLSARIDFWTKYAYSSGVEYKASTETGTDVDGYEYKVFKDATETTPTSSDIFKLVAVVPFNVNKGNEYYIKRTSTAANYAARADGSVAPLYMPHEASGSWVLDCYSNAAKTAASHPAHLINTLTAVQALEEDADDWLFMKDVQTTNKKYTISGKDNIIVGYPMENTVDDNSPLYYHATGLAFFGYYYRNGTKDAAHTTPMVFYGYLRHRGEESSTSYPAVLAEDLDAEETISSLGTPSASRPAMNYGVVRNNIYRVSIDRITEKGELKYTIKVKKWDPFTHKAIFM